MTNSSLIHEIACLDKDIDRCKGKVSFNTGKKTVCPPNCYCDQRITIDQRNFASSLRRKTSSATVTKTDITPHDYIERDNSAKVAGNIRKESKPSTAKSKCIMDDHEDYMCCANTRVNNCKRSQVGRSRDDLHHNSDHLEPVKLPKKSSRIKREGSWSTILQQNNRQFNKDLYSYIVPTKEMYTQKNSSTCGSVGSSTAVETQSVYVKNRGVQCDENYLTKDNSDPKKDPLNNVQYLIMNMKSRLRDDPWLGSMLDEMEVELRRIPFDRGDNQAVGDATSTNRGGSYDKYINPRPQFPKQNTSYEDVMNLEATYLELEAACSKLKHERDSAIEKASQKSAELVESMRREVITKARLNETNAKIKEMSAKLETYTKSMEGLTEHVKVLQHENKDVERLRGQVSQLNSLLRDATMENKSLLTELQLVSIERNKLEVVLAEKEHLLETKTKELESLTQLLLEKVQVEKSTTAEVIKKKRNSRKSNRKELNENQSTKQRAAHSSPNLITSSPNSTANPLPASTLNSWFNCSSIADCNNGKSHKEPIISVEQMGNVQISPQQQQRNNGNTQERRLDVSKIEKLREEIRHMFSEMRALATDVPSLPVVEFTGVSGEEEASSEVNWTDLSGSADSCESISSDANSLDCEEIEKS